MVVCCIVLVCNIWFTILKDQTQEVQEKSRCIMISEPLQTRISPETLFVMKELIQFKPGTM